MPLDAAATTAKPTHAANAVEGGRGWLRVGLGPEAARWTTRGRTSTVLFVVHNVTSATRLMDVIPLFDGDLRVSLFATCTGSSPFQAGVQELLAELGLPVVPWEQAKTERFDLIVSGSYGGELHELTGKLAVLSHGMGYNKILSREPGAGSREPGAGSREPGAGSREPAFGMSAEWLLHEGEPIADFTVFSHPEQLARLASSCPQATPTAVLAGDPCYDRLLEALPHRERYRTALRVEPGQRLVVLNSTWNPGSLFGDEHDILPLLLDRLRTDPPVDEYRVAAVLHPNIWHGHGPGQIRGWLERARRAGMLLIAPLDGWRQTLAAADCVVGDHGSVSYYAAAVGLPVLLAAFPADDLDPASPVARFGRIADRLDPDRPLRPQIDDQIRTHRPGRFAELTALASSDPGRSAQLLRELFYRALGIAEPSYAAELDGLAPAPVGFAPPTCALRVLASATATLNLTRYPESADPAERSYADHVHLSVCEHTPDFGALRRADLVMTYAENTGRDAADWLEQASRRYPHTSMLAACTGPGRAVARFRDGRRFTLRCAEHRCDPGPLASALLAHLDLKAPATDESFRLEASTGAVTHTVRITPWR